MRKDKEKPCSPEKTGLHEKGGKLRVGEKESSLRDMLEPEQSVVSSQHDQSDSWDREVKTFKALN